MKFTYKDITNSLKDLGLLELMNLEKALYKELDRRTEKLNTYKKIDERRNKK